jgi:two-component system sensor histidine kinase UhpB
LKRLVTTLFVSLSLVVQVNAQTARIDSLLNIVAQGKKDTITLKVIHELGIEFSRKDIAKEKELVYKGVTIAKQIHYDHLTGFYALLTTAHQASGNMDSAMFYLGLLESAHKKAPNDKRIALNFNQTAGLFYKNVGRPKDALPYIIKTVDLTTDATTRAGMMLNVGNNYVELGELKTAAGYFLESLALFDKLGNKRGQAFVYNSLGNDYGKMKQWAKAKPYFEKSLKLKEELKDNRGMMNALGGIGNASMELGDYAPALEAFRKAYDMASEMKLNVEQGQALHNLGEVYQRMKDPTTSRSYFEQALVYAKQSNDKAWVAWIESNLLQLDEDKKSKALMEAGLLKSLAQYEETGDKIGIANSHHNLSEFYARHRDFDKAFKHLRTAGALDDSTRGLSVEAQLLKLEQQYANEKKDREMELLRKDQQLRTAGLERTRAIQAGVIIALILVLIIGMLLVNRRRVVSRSRRFAEIEKMRNAIARDLHDDIGSTLSSINILSQLAIREADMATASNGHASKHFTKIAEQSSRMMESMSDIVWSISPGNDSLDHVVMKMKEFAAEILEPKNITYKFSGDDSLKDTTLSPDRRKNLFLIFKEAVNNAAKYSGATDLEIRFVRQGNTLSLSVSDNGHGFEPETVKAGNGLKNMKERARALSARFDFATGLRKGTRVALELPIT